MNHLSRRDPDAAPAMAAGDAPAARLREDEAARVRALEPRSFIVEAPAGAGKTELLSQRYLMLLATVAHPEEIVAITFTNKAATEMRNRILGNLQGASVGQRPAEAHRQTTFELATAVLARSNELGWQLLDQPERLRILTIDALCGALARQMPLLSRFGSQPEVTDDAEPLYLEAAEQTLALLESGLPGVSDVVAAVLAYLDNDSVRLCRLLGKMLATRDQWLHNAHAGLDSTDVLRQLVDDEIADVARLFDADLQRELMPLVRFAADNVEDDAPLTLLRSWCEPLAPDHGALPRWLALCDLLLTSKGEWRKALNRNQGFPPGPAGQAHKEAMLAQVAGLRERVGLDGVLARLRRLPLADACEDEGAIVRNLAALLRLASATLWQVFQARGQTDFIEIAQRALQALGDDAGPTELALRLDYRLRHLLVDEFQDTSPVQVRLLERLTAGWMPDDGRTLFCVGDPMQSIYRFRKADVGLFLQAAHGGIGGIPLERLQLTRNNRSCPEVVDWVNGAFAGLFPSQDNVARGAIRYRPFVATRASLPGAGVEVHPLCVSPELAATEADRLEAERIMAIIDRTWAEDPARNIAVLVRARTHLAPLVAEIRASRPDLRYQAVEIEALGGRQWIADLITLTRALCHRADRIAWLALLRAPWCGLCLADLHRLAADDRYATLPALLDDEARVAGLSEDGQARLAHLRAVIDDALAHQGRQGMARWIEGVWLQLDGPALLPDAGAAQDVEAWFDLVERLEAGGGLDLERLQAEVDKLYAAPDPGADGRLRFMTIHKSKGLEFDTVILPGLQRSVGQNDTPLLRWEEVALSDGGTGLVVAPLTARGGKGGAPATYHYLQTLEAERGNNEDLRVLYVASTRAIRALHLVGLSRLTADSGQPVAPGGTPLRTMWPVLAPQFESSPPLTPDPADPHGFLPAYEDFVPPLLRLRAIGQPAALRVEPPCGDETSAVQGEDASPAGRHALEADFGTLVHRYLELIARSGVEAWPVDRIERLRPAMARWLSLQGHAPAAAESASVGIVAMLSRTVASETGRWVLAQRADAASELALATASDATIRIHVVDRTFVEDGTRWIIDFKSAELPQPLDDAAVAAHAAQYRDQLARYAKLFRGDGRPLRCAIYYTAHDRLVDVAV
ncbi:UvrD-helicase domain-containing protein [Rhodocyclaceae bacterium SMB388]